MPETPAPKPDAAGDIRVVGDKVEIYDGVSWVRHERLSDLGPLTILRGGGSPDDEPEKAGE